MSEWKEKKLKDLVDIRPSNVDKKIYEHKSLVKLCNYMDVYSNNYLTSEINYTTGSVDLNERQRFELKKDDVVITKDSETPADIAVSAVVTETLENVVCGYHLAILRPNKNQLDGHFLMLKLKEPELKNYFFRVTNGSTRYGLTIGNIENATITFPEDIAEQRKIAHILTTLDGVIEQTRAAIAKYKAIKQGLLHDLFTRGIDLKTGKLRAEASGAPELYKESFLGLVPKEWEVKALEELCDAIGDGIHTTPKYTSQSNFYFINGNNLVNGKVYIDEQTNCVDEDEYNKHFKELNKKTILYSINGTIGNIAFYRNENIILGKSACYITCKSSFDELFLYYFLQNEAVIKYFENELTGSTIKNLSLASIRATPIFLLSNEEKNRTIMKLKSIDNQIDREEATLTKYQQLKSGLMTDLLSGSTRVLLSETAN
jgi:type I restriction enzyme, S subunit